MDSPTASATADVSDGDLIDLAISAVCEALIELELIQRRDGAQADPATRAATSLRRALATLRLLHSPRRRPLAYGFVLAGQGEGSLD